MVSKALSKLLRHAAGEAGIALDGEGYGRLDLVVSLCYESPFASLMVLIYFLPFILLLISSFIIHSPPTLLTTPQMQWPRLKSLKVTVPEIKAAVADNAKQRFSMKPDPALSPPPDPLSDDPAHWLIRANQGHSIAVDAEALLKPVSVEAGNVPAVVVHGTYFAFYQAIVDSGGLKRMKRNHIHFSTGLPEERGGVISGMRGDAEVLIYIDIKRSLDDGVRWFVSENGVLLTDGGEGGVLSTRYFQKVVGRREDIGVLWEDGEERAELPERFRGRKPPMGKGPAPRGQGGRRGGKKDG